MARATTAENGGISNGIVMPLLEVLMSVLVLDFLPSLVPLPLVALMSTLPLLGLIASLTSTRETLPPAPPIVSTTVSKTIVIAALPVTTAVTSVLGVVSTFAPPLTTTDAPLMMTMNLTSTPTLTLMEVSRVLRTTLG